jgi:hypothetical protein
MFSKNKGFIVKGLRAVQKNLCRYFGDTCDCKYGAEDLKPFGTRSWGEQTGCPEVRTAIAILSVMTDEEYDALAKRAGLLIFDV